ncbi:hypothetical protein [Plantibacter sp. LMC-P-059a]|uniref:hypothetical protein n=1 Tax=Plantibacter sp. LMC-P-059a TaxID=3040297 RepID=UPI00254D46F7|nr:hypothetical protein [Plantibacter sp. LMC-P-059a]
MQRGDEPVTVRPHPRILFNTVLSAAIVILPVWGVSLWLVGPAPSMEHTWVVTLGIVGLIALLILATLSRRRRIVVCHDGFIEQPVLGRQRFVPRQAIGRSLLFEFGGRGQRTSSQFFVCDTENRPLLRMRSSRWSNDSITAVVAAYEGPVERPRQPVSLDDLREDHPGLLTPLERLRWARAELL